MDNRLQPSDSRPEKVRQTEGAITDWHTLLWQNKGVYARIFHFKWNGTKRAIRCQTGRIFGNRNFRHFPNTSRLCQALKVESFYLHKCTYVNYGSFQAQQWSLWGTKHSTDSMTNNKRIWCLMFEIWHFITHSYSMLQAKASWMQEKHFIIKYHQQKKTSSLFNNCVTRKKITLYLK